VCNLHISTKNLNELSPSSTGKTVRINLAKRLGLPQLNDQIPVSQRHFEAEVPSPKAPLSQKIQCSHVSLSSQELERVLERMNEVNDFAFNMCADGSVELYLSVDSRCLMDSKQIRAIIAKEVDGYLVPENIYVLHNSLTRFKSGEATFEEAKRKSALLNASSMSKTEQHIRDFIAEMLSIDSANIMAQSDFFLLGGTSLLLGKLAYQIRKETGAQVGVSALFNNCTIAGMACLVDADTSKGTSFISSDEKLSPRNLSASTSLTAFGFEYDYDQEYQVFEKKKARGQNHPLCLIVQSMPLLFFYPLKAALTCKSPLLLTTQALIHHRVTLALNSLLYCAVPQRWLLGQAGYASGSYRGLQISCQDCRSSDCHSIQMDCHRKIQGGNLSHVREFFVGMRLRPILT